MADTAATECFGMQALDAVALVFPFFWFVFVGFSDTWWPLTDKF